MGSEMCIRDRFKHIMDTFINDSFSSRVGSVRGTIDRTGVRGKGNVASALVQRPSSDIDKAKTGRYRAHKTRTEAFWSVESLVQSISECFGQGTFKLRFGLSEFIN